MKTLTVQEAQSQLGQLIAEANHGSVIVLTDGQQQVTLSPGAALDLERDSPELEAELLKGIDGPFTPYSPEEMRGIVERIIREESRGDSADDLISVRLSAQKTDSVGVSVINNSRQSVNFRTTARADSPHFVF